MITKDLKYRLSLFVKSKEIGNEIYNRLLIADIPNGKEGAISILAKISPDLNDQIYHKFNLNIRDNNVVNFNEIAENINEYVNLIQDLAKGNPIINHNKLKYHLLNQSALDALALALKDVNSVKDFEVLYNRMVLSIESIKASIFAIKEPLIKKRIRFKK